jgi:hypothetical protein
MDGTRSLYGRNNCTRSCDAGGWSILDANGYHPLQAGPTPEHILQLGLAFWGSKTLLSAVELGLFTELASGPKDVDAIMA